nr:MAG TPA: hypothetical protein [Caudoviricetes sp.]
MDYYFSEMNPSCAPIKCPTTFPMTKEIKNTISVTMLGSSLFFIVFLLLHSLVQEFIHEVHLSLAGDLGRTRCLNRSVRVRNNFFTHLLMYLVLIYRRIRHIICTQAPQSLLTRKEKLLYGRRNHFFRLLPRIAKAI